MKVARKLGAGSTSKPRIRTCRFEDAKGPRWDFVACEVCRNLPPSTPQFKTISTRSATFTHVTTSSSIVPPLSTSGAVSARPNTQLDCPFKDGFESDRHHHWGHASTPTFDRDDRGAGIRGQFMTNIDNLSTKCFDLILLGERRQTTMILVTGFQAYAGRNINPAARLAEALDGAVIAGHSVTNRLLPVDMAFVAKEVPRILDEVSPDIVLSLGLWPGEAVLRLEQTAVNHSRFELPDSKGLKSVGAVREDGAQAYLTGLPINAMQRALRANGLPCRISGTAGSYLCNALFYIMSDECARRGQGRVGFMHLPYLPEQVAALLDDVEAHEELEQHQRADLASMSFEMMERGARLALACAVEAMHG
jgi:pyroglutamyl-peptidase